MRKPTSAELTVLALFALLCLLAVLNELRAL